MKYKMKCRNCDWTDEADRIADVVAPMEQHEFLTEEAGDAHTTAYYGPKGSVGRLWWARRMARQVVKMQAGRKRQARQAASNPMGTPATPRDTQRERVYAAEREMYSAGLNGGVFQDAAQMQAYTDKVMQSRFVASLVTPRYRSTVGATTVRVVREGHSRGSVHAHVLRRSYDIRMPLPTNHKIRNDRWTPLYLIHEIAHIVEDFIEEGRHEANHGRTFVRVYLALVKRFLGPEMEFALKAELRARRVKWHKTGQRAPMTTEEKAVVARRLAAARAK